MTAGLWLAHTKSELLQLLRSPGYLVPTLIFPALLFSFFGISASNRYPAAASTILASWSVYAVLGVAFYQFGVGIAQSREMHWTTYLRTLPAGPAPQFAAQLATAMVFAILATAVLWLLAFGTTPVSFDAATVLRLALVLALGSIPFAGLGIAIGYTVNARAAVPVANLIYLPIAYAGGLWLPPDRLPVMVQEVSPHLPTRMLGEIAWATAEGRSLPWMAVGGLAAYGVAFIAFASWQFRREERRRYR